MLIFKMEEIKKYYKALCERTWNVNFPKTDIPCDVEDRVNVRYADAEILYFLDLLHIEIENLRKEIKQ